MDDNVGLVELLMRYLASHACQVISAESGVEGLQLANQYLPDAILLDVMMPGVDGWKVLQILRSNPQTASTPVIVCSVFNDPQLAYSLGATAFLAKPVRRDNILSVLSGLKVL